ncbi:YbaB/EbfC family nucleoid-associated protein [Thermoanaerobacter sp. A7A]|uniref:YbaB/EbfC family nucleoid-associated protein n=1 Tax=Thermoanaerobacter sp. A7A TaxID=1350366 RepID=UPI000401D6F0|nr:YbaB/EbfC family nucleoid-associated protein [Thermoanaerobacter sp. A7A]
MAKGGFPGGFNINNMIKQAQQMQEEMKRVQEELVQKTVEATAGGGMVKVVANGRKELVSIEISPDVVDKEDVEMLEDLVLAAVNQALRNAEEMIASEMAKITGGLNIPGLF